MLVSMKIKCPILVVNLKFKICEGETPERENPARNTLPHSNFGFRKQPYSLCECQRTNTETTPCKDLSTNQCLQFDGGV